jgi:hypothetical protein
MLPEFPMTTFSIPFTIIDLASYQIITSKILPGDISDSKEIIITEQAIPGLSFSPLQQAGMGNRHISFTIPVIKRNNATGNVLHLKQWESLRQKAFNITELFSIGKGQFRGAPKVVFNWGTGSLPLVYYVKKCEMVHKAGWTNMIGNPQNTDVSIELILDEEHFMNKAEEIFRKISAMGGVIETMLEAFQRQGARTY